MEIIGFVVFVGVASFAVHYVANGVLDVYEEATGKPNSRKKGRR